MIKGNDGGMFDLCYSFTGYDFYNSKFCFSDEVWKWMRNLYIQMVLSASRLTMLLCLTPSVFLIALQSTCVVLSAIWSMSMSNRLLACTWFRVC